MSYIKHQGSSGLSSLDPSATSPRFGSQIKGITAAGGPEEERHDSSPVTQVTYVGD